MCGRVSVTVAKLIKTASLGIKLLLSRLGLNKSVLNRFKFFFRLQTGLPGGFLIAQSLFHVG